MTGKLCDYGCGQDAIYQFKNGKWCCSKYHQHCPSLRKKNSESLVGHKGRFFSIKQKQEIGNKIKNIWKDINSKFNSEEFRDKIKHFGKDNGFYRKTFTKEQLNKIKESHKKIWKDPLSIFNSKQYRDHHKSSLKKFSNTDQGKFLRSKAAKERWNRKDSKQNHSKIIKEKWRNGIYNDVSFYKGQKTKPEKQIQIMLDFLFPNQYTYTGDHSFWIGRKNPDFKNNNEKKIIEIFGCYWHGKERTKICNLIHELNYISYYQKSGYKCLVIWEHESPVSISKKIIDFHIERSNNEL